MPKIVLIRHVTPLVDLGWCSSRQAQERLEQYNQTEQLALAELAHFRQTATYQDILNIRHILVSPLIRAYRTAENLFPDHTLITIDDLQEWDLKIIQIPFLKLSLKSWFVFSRILWFLGINRTARNFSQEKQRIKQLIPTLLAQDTVIVAHGFVLNEIKRAIKQKNFVKLFSEKQGCFSVEVFN
ncbi:MAG TPA: histidine phosphatase [Pasteurellaceae bacterium]|nr:histidine phosphatase [Pasteurellaceae bacterium]